MHLSNYRVTNLIVTALFAATAALFAFGTAAHAATEPYAEGATAAGTCASVTNALTDNGVRATCDDGEFVTITDFDLLDIVPLGAEDISFTVRVAARVTNNDGTDVARVSLSWNGGTDYTTSSATASINAEPGNSDSIVTAPSSGACGNFGRTWSFAELVNGAFIVRVTADPNSGSQDIQIDDIDVRACWAGRDVQSVQVNGSASVELDPNSNVNVRVDVLHTAVAGLSTSSDNDWESTRWTIGANTQCVNHADFTGTGTNNTTFSADVPNSSGIFDVLITAHKDDSCATGSSAIFILNDAIDTTNGVAPISGDHPYIEGNSGTGTCANAVFAVVDDNNRAICDDGEYVTLSGFDLDQLVPTNAEDISFTVRVAARTSDNDGTDVAEASLSWNGGDDYSTVHETASIEAMSGDDSVVTAHSTGACSLFGRSWTRAELTDANFRVRVEAAPGDTNEQISINDVDVRVCWAGRLVDNVRVDGASSTDVDPGDDIDVTVDVLHVDAPGVSNADDNDWESTRWILGPNSACVNHVDFTDSDTDRLTFTVPAPNISAVYDLYITAFKDDACGSGASDTFILDNAVDTRFGSPGPSPDTDPSFTCEDIPNDAKFLWLLARGNPGMLRNFERGHIPPGLLKSFAGRHSGWDWDDWADFDCDDLDELFEKWWDDDDDHRPGRGRGRR
jgi:hypothetical protein